MMPDHGQAILMKVLERRKKIVGLSRHYQIFNALKIGI